LGHYLGHYNAMAEVIIHFLGWCYNGVWFGQNYFLDLFTASAKLVDNMNIGLAFLDSNELIRFAILLMIEYDTFGLSVINLDYL
jgi:hypothetical protein